ncbi:MAG TPA: hypothetical protein VIW68_13450 [Candidatus Sulfotelmatobacter sp.]
MEKKFPIVRYQIERFQIAHFRIEIRIENPLENQTATQTHPAPTLPRFRQSK